MLISQSSVLGLVPISQQRIFHYGRELKTLGRTLHGLGVGRFTKNSDNKTGPIIVIHLHAIPHSTAEKTIDTTATTKNQTLTALTIQRTNRTTTRATTSAPFGTTATATTSTSSLPSTTNQVPLPEVVDLYSDDENDEIVVVVNKPNTSASTTATTTTMNNHSNKRRRT